MAKLIVLLKQKQIQELELTTDKVTIGREESNTIKLDDALISRNHAEIKEEGGKYFLTDVGSANGTFVGARRITTNYELKSGDVIKISPYTIYFQLSAAETPTRIERPERPEDKTKIIGAGVPGAEAVGRDMTQMYTYSGAPRLLIRSGVEVGQTFDLSKNPIIGRDAECDIVLNEPTVSRKHARIQFIDNKLTIVDVGSRSGTRVNGKVIDKPTPLKDGDKIQVGEVTLEVDWKGAPKLAEEKATVPYFRPEPVAPAKAEWWKWAVGIAAGIIIVAAVIWFTRIDRVPYETRFSNAQTYYEKGKQTSDTEMLEKALSEVNQAIKKRPDEVKATDLKADIEKTIININESKEYTEKAKQEIQAGNLEQAIIYLKNALEKDPNNKQAELSKIETHKTLATQYEISGDKRRPADIRGSNELYDKAINHWNEVLKIKPLDNEATTMKEKVIKKKVVTSTQPTEPTPYDRALRAYRNGDLAQAREILKNVPTSDRKEELLGWTDLWEQANYNRERLNDIPAAIAKFDELYKRDPNNTVVRDILIKLRGGGASGWNYNQALIWYNEAKDDWQNWNDYGNQAALKKAQEKYQLIVNLGQPPSNASVEEWDIYNKAKERLAIKP